MSLRREAKPPTTGDGAWKLRKYGSVTIRSRNFRRKFSNDCKKSGKMPLLYIEGSAVSTEAARQAKLSLHKGVDFMKPLDNELLEL